MKMKPLLVILFLMSLGMIGGNYIIFPVQLFFILLIALICLILITLFRSNKIAEACSTFMLGIAIFLFGMLWLKLTYENNKPFPTALSTVLKDQRFSIKGTIITKPKPGDYSSSAQLKIDSIQAGTFRWANTGKIQAYLPKSGRRIYYGDQVQLTGTLRAPQSVRNPGAFDFSKFLAARGIHHLFSVSDSADVQLISKKHGSPLNIKLVSPLRENILRKLDRLSSPGTANLLKGLLLGEKRNIPPRFLQSLAKTGTSHILAVSGLHTGFVMLFLWLVLQMLRLPRVLTVIITISGLVLFAQLTHLKPPVVRSVIMASIFLIGTLVQRRRDNYNTLAAAGIILLLINPAELFNPGFQLSFSAVFSILYFFPIMRNFLKSNPYFKFLIQFKGSDYIVSLFLISLAVQIGTLPLTTTYFNLIPLLGIFANIIVVPLIGLMLFLGIGSVTLATVSTTLAGYYMEVNELLAQILVGIVQWVADLPGSFVHIAQPKVEWIILYYLILLMLSQWSQLKIRRWAFMSVLLMLNFVVWKSVLQDKPVIKVTHFDVGQGDAALIQIPTGQTILVDGGDWSPGFDNGERVIAPFLRRHGITQLDFIIATHPHHDHIGGLPFLLANFSPGLLITNGDSSGSPLFRKYISLIDSLAITNTTFGCGKIVRFAPGLELWVMSPIDFPPKLKHATNNKSIVFKLIYGRIAFLFTGDAEQEAEYYLSQFGDLLACEVLKAGHHGSETSSTEEFLSRINPEMAVISVGERNRFSHPDEQTLNRLSERKIQILRTDREGAIVFESDGLQVKRINWKAESWSSLY